ncbi:MAG: hypothetical protein RIK87_23535 [Fuerstiella sp.]
MSEPFNSLSTDVAVIDKDGVYVLSPLVDVDALTLLSCLAEDPAEWSDIGLIWPRYRFHAENAEFAGSLPFREMTIEQTVDLLAGSAAWFVVDLVNRRLLTGGDLPTLQLRGGPVCQDDPDAHVTVLPPWWELCQHVSPVTLFDPRQTPLRIPDPRRDVLWGPAMTDFFAGQMLAAIRAGRTWIGRDRDGQPCGSHDLTVELHRDWLMTPHEALDGGIPRDCLHGGKEWIEDLARGQEFRICQREASIPIPTELSTFENAAMGSNEVITYFDACRETLHAGWRWLLADRTRLDQPQVAGRLSAAMNDFLGEWLVTPAEDGIQPQEVIRCDRLRIPLVSDGSEHVIDCDCPICEMMGSDLFGPAITRLDDWMLDAEAEFAFSRHATREAWEEGQREWGMMDAEFAADTEPHTEPEDDKDQDFDSVWSSVYVADEDIPGDTGGHLKMAFLLADLVGSLKADNADQSDVDQLNAAFRAYRTASSPDEIASTAESFRQSLEELATKHDSLVSRAADLQSRIDEQSRRLAVDDRDVSR